MSETTHDYRVEAPRSPEARLRVIGGGTLAVYDEIARLKQRLDWLVERKRPHTEALSVTSDRDYALLGVLDEEIAIIPQIINEFDIDNHVD